MANIGKISVILTADAQGVHAAVDGGIKKFKEFDKAASNVGQGLKFGAAAGAGMAAFDLLKNGLGGLFDFIKQSGEAVIQLGKMADRFGTTTEKMQAFQFAAKLAGVDLEVAEGALAHFQRTLGQASIGNQEAIDKFEILRLNVKDLAKEDTITAFGKWSDEVNKLNSSTERAAVSFPILGREGSRAGALIKEGSAGIAAADDKLGRIGGRISAEDVAGLKLAHESLVQMEQVVTAIGQKAAIQLAPVVAGVADLFLKWVEEAGGIDKLILPALDAVVEVMAKLLDVLDGLQDMGDFFQGFMTMGGLLGGGGEGGAGSRLMEGWQDKVRNKLKEASKPSGDFGDDPLIDDLNEKVMKLSQSVKEQIAVFGLSGDQAKLFALTQGGASDAVTKQVQALIGQLDALNSVNGAAASATGVMEGLRLKMEALAKLAHDGVINDKQAKTISDRLSGSPLEKQLSDRIGAALKAAKTPLDELRGSLEDFDRALKDKMLTPAQYAMVVSDAFDKAAKSAGSLEMSHPGFAAAGSQAAFATIDRTGDRSNVQSIAEILSAMKAENARKLSEVRDRCQDIVSELRNQGVLNL